LAANIVPAANRTAAVRNLRMLSIVTLGWILRHSATKTAASRADFL
jgi:hypothetical protein